MNLWQSWVLFLIHLTVARAWVVPDARYNRYSLEDEDLAWTDRQGTKIDLDDVLARLRLVNPAPEPPQIQIQLLKGHVFPENEDWKVSTQYTYSSSKFKPEKSEEDANSRTIEAEKNEEDNSIKYSGVPQLGSRTIITAPSYCPKGQRKDSRGVCRRIIKSCLLTKTC